MSEYTIPHRVVIITSSITSTLTHLNTIMSQLSDNTSVTIPDTMDTMDTMDSINSLAAPRVQNTVVPLVEELEELEELENPAIVVDPIDDLWYDLEYRLFNDTD
jgi:PHP family Zn ribbon phosphoesterase